MLRILYLGRRRRVLRPRWSGGPRTSPRAETQWYQANGPTSKWSHENPKDEQDPNKPKFDPRLLSPKELEIVQYALRLMVAASRPPAETVEAEVERWPENESEA